MHAAVLCAMPTAIIQTFLFALYSNILTRSAFVFSLRFIIYCMPALPLQYKARFSKEFYECPVNESYLRE